MKREYQIQTGRSTLEALLKNEEAMARIGRVVGQDFGGSEDGETLWVPVEAAAEVCALLNAVQGECLGDYLDGLEGEPPTVAVMAVDHQKTDEQRDLSGNTYYKNLETPPLEDVTLRVDMC